MYQTTPPVSRPLNGMGNELIDGSGTINPAALNSPGMTCNPFVPRPHPSYWLKCKVLNHNASQQPCGRCIVAMSKVDQLCVTAVLPPSSIEPSPRGIKRSHSPDHYQDLAGERDVGGTCSLLADLSWTSSFRPHTLPYNPSAFLGAQLRGFY